MKAEALIEELHKVAAQLGVAVTYEPLVNTVSAGGLCRVRGEYRIIIERRSSAYERALALAKALSGLDTREAAMSDRTRGLLNRYAS